MSIYRANCSIVVSCRRCCSRKIVGFGLEVGYAKVASEVVYIRAWLRLAP